MPAEDSPVVAARRARLKAWIDDQFGGRQVDFIARVGINQGELSGLLNGRKSFGEKKAETLELAAGMPRDHLVRPLPAATSDETWADVIGYAQAAGLGSGPEAAEWAETHKLKFRKDSLAKKRLSPSRLSVLYGSGDSMEPTIKEGDAILFDLSDTTPKSRGIYVLLVPGAGADEYVVKRALVNKGAVLFAADNPEGDHNWKEPRPMGSRSYPIKVIGRVQWIGRWVK